MIIKIFLNSYLYIELSLRKIPVQSYNKNNKTPIFSYEKTEKRTKTLTFSKFYYYLTSLQLLNTTCIYSRIASFSFFWKKRC